MGASPSVVPFVLLVWRFADKAVQIPVAANICRFSGGNARLDASASCSLCGPFGLLVGEVCRAAWHAVLLAGLQSFGACLVGSLGVVSGVQLLLVHQSGSEAVCRHNDAAERALQTHSYVAVSDHAR
jgi:hypothetical protein